MLGLERIPYKLVHKLLIMPVFDAIPIQTDRLLLRPFRSSDAQDIFDMYSDPKVMRFWSSPPWESVERAHEVIERDIKAFQNGEHLCLVLERAEDSRLIGQCTLFKFSESCRRAEIGYCLASWTWGNGYMNEALRAIIHYGFERLNLNRIEADIDPLNEASVKTVERLGFVREGLLRERWIVNEQVSDSVIYGLIRKDWQSHEPGTKGVTALK